MRGHTPTKPKPHTRVARGSLDDCRDGFRIDVRAIVSAMFLLDLVTIAVAGYCALFVNVLYFNAHAMKRKVEVEGLEVLPVLLLPYLVLADLIVRAAS